ncbi:RNA 3'-terminal phosphate cyclase [Talaromyces pinophilus]|uniref:RNA 3'-terminal phosphate cyclase n=1 Tax=Talaromyces pinophilus TaxID=128442 RepID=A0A6V8H6B6_TALPI|nr:RNA 3'-terminal phosphate cyclase [Talaromyces pinophilus]
MASEPDKDGKALSTGNTSDEQERTIHLDGRMLEGGGQLVRNAVALSALTGLSITITNIRGNRQGRRGLKGSHAAAIGFIAEVCQGEVVGGHVGSQKMMFYPRKRDSSQSREQTVSSAPLQTILSKWDAPAIKPEYNINQSTAGSISLVFQALYPYLVYASSLSTVDTKGPIKVHITGGTNVTSSPSFDYIQQVLVPNLRTLGLPKLNARLHKRGWSAGPRDLGSVTFDVFPLERSIKPQTDHWFPVLKLHEYRRTAVTKIDITILAPEINIQQQEAHGNRQDRRRAKHVKTRNYDYDMFPNWTIREYLEEQSQKSLRRALKGLDDSSQEIPINIHLSEATGHHTHTYILLVAHMSNGLTLGSDALFDGYVKRDGRNKGDGSGSNIIATLDNLVNSCVASLTEELSGLNKDGETTGKHQPAVDVHMRDQLVIFEALGLLSKPARQIDEVGVSKEHDAEDERYWSLHTRTARWVCEQILLEYGHPKHTSVCAKTG